MAVGLTALSFILEKREGLLDRSWVTGNKIVMFYFLKSAKKFYISGVTPFEVVLAHLVTQTGILIVQITLILVFMFPVFNIPCEGNIFWVILMSFLQGLCGMCFGKQIIILQIKVSI